MDFILQQPLNLLRQLVIFRMDRPYSGHGDGCVYFALYQFVDNVPHVRCHFSRHFDVVRVLSYLTVTLVVLLELRHPVPVIRIQGFSRLKLRLPIL